MKIDKRLTLFLFLAGIFITCLLIGDLIGSKLYYTKFFGLDLTISVGMIPFPVTFLLTDLLNEFYGKRAAATVTLVGFVCAAFTLVLVNVAAAVPPASFSAITQESFENAFVNSNRMFAASLLAYLVGQFTDIGIFTVAKRITQNRMLWLRATGSTLLSQLVDTCVIHPLRWIGTEQEPQLMNIMITSYAAKVAAAIALTPLLYAGHAAMQRLFKMDAVVLGPDGNPIQDPESGESVLHR